MSARSSVAEPATLPPRAELARLTLQVRAALSRAEQAERAVAEQSADAAAVVLRERLAALLAERRTALAAELREVEREAAELVEAARGEARALAARRAARRAEIAVPPSPLPVAPPVAPPEQPRLPAPPSPLASAPVALIAAPPPPPVVPSSWAPPSAVAPVVAHPVTVMIDPESFGQAVAAAIAAVLAQRPEVLTPRAPMTQWVHAVPVAAQHKKSFWSGLWHADVVLAVLAMAIILVILLAWSV
jgi:hypothetical protein